MILLIFFIDLGPISKIKSSSETSLNSFICDGPFKSLLTAISSG